MKLLTGIVTSNSMDKTVAVSIESKWQHPVYKKTVKKTKKYLAHDTKGAGVGDQVTLIEIKPMSKRKKWEVSEITAKATLTTEPIKSEKSDTPKVKPVKTTTKAKTKSKKK